MSPRQWLAFACVSVFVLYVACCAVTNVNQEVGIHLQQKARILEHQRRAYELMEELKKRNHGVPMEEWSKEDQASYEVLVIGLKSLRDY